MEEELIIPTIMRQYPNIYKSLQERITPEQQKLFDENNCRNRTHSLSYTIKDISDADSIYIKTNEQGIYQYDIEIVDDISFTKGGNIYYFQYKNFVGDSSRVENAFNQVFTKISRTQLYKTYHFRILEVSEKYVVLFQFSI